MVGYAGDAGRFFIYVALLNMFQVGWMVGGTEDRWGGGFRAARAGTCR